MEIAGIRQDGFWEGENEGSNIAFLCLHTNLI
jgi:hypothetical protein